MKGHFIVIAVLFLTSTLTAQINLPINNNSGPVTSISKTFQIYDSIRALTDSSSARDRKLIDRWRYHNYPRMSITNDSIFDDTSYAKALQSFVESELFCNTDIVSDWTNVGPRKMGQWNGLIDAVFYNPSYPNEVFLGVQRAGIFKCSNFGGDYDTLKWQCVTDNLDYPILGITQILGSPFDEDIMVAICGIETGFDYLQCGYLESADRGETWTLSTWTSILPDKDQFKFFAFDPETSGRLLAITERHIIVSHDNGNDWEVVTLPTDLPDSADIHFRKIAIAGDNILLISEEAGVTGFWRGEMQTLVGNYLPVNWTANIVSDLYEVTSPIFKPGASFGGLATVNDYSNFAQETFPKFDYFNSSAVGCNYNTGTPQNYPNYPPNQNGFQGAWNYIKTGGWQHEVVSGNPDPRITCEKDEDYNIEILTQRKTINVLNLLDHTNFESYVRAHIPEGMKLTVCFSPYTTATGSSTPSFHSWNAPCNLSDFEYETDWKNSEIFSGVLFEMQSYAPAGGLDIDSTQNFVLPISMQNLLQTNIDSSNIQNPANSLSFIYYIIEIDSNTYNNGNKFVLTRFDVREKVPTVLHINISNVVHVNGSNNDRLYVHAQNAARSQIWRSTNDGNTFDLKDEPNVLPAKHSIEEIIASEINEDIYYYAQVNNGTNAGPHRFNVVNQNIPVNFEGILNGHHDDYRSSYITTVNGKDFVLWGNDGGIAYTPDGTKDTADLICLNGDLSVNGIYTMDIHEKTNKVLLGLQDNATHAFYANQDDWEVAYNHLGDGSVAMIRKSNPSQTIHGDPQKGKAKLIADHPNNAAPLGIVKDTLDELKAESFLGVQLEKFRFDDTRFVMGLRRVDSSLYGKVLINEGYEQTNKYPIYGSDWIGSIAICQRHPDVIFAADDIFKNEDNDPLTNLELAKIHKSSDGGHTWTNLLSTTVYVNGNTENLGEYARWSYVAALALDHLDSNLLYGGMSGVGKLNQVIEHEYFRVIKSINGGTSFVDWSEGLPAMPVNNLLTIESSNHIVFCAMDVGIYYRMDGMDKWECFSNKLPKCRVTDMAYNYCTKELYCSTYGRGVWRTPVNLYTGTDVNLEITSNTTWNTPQELTENIVVKSGKTLIINDNVYMEADRKIIVEPGARLVVQDSAVITSNCDQFWDGIEVWGDPTAIQQSAYQGMVTITGGASIQNAKNAIRVWKPGDWNSMGGIVQATNAHFINNKRDVEFMPYSGSNVGSTAGNKSYFTQCTFKTDTNFMGTVVSPHVTMYKVDGVRFTACDFADERIVDASLRSKGIHTLDSKYKVLGKFIGSSPAQVNYFDDVLYDPCTFTNLTHGIWAGSANSQNTVMVDQALFTDCEYGVVISQVDNAVISRNKFDRTTESEWFSYQYDIFTDKSTGYFIEGNMLTKQPDTDPVIGITNQNSGLENNEVRRNKATDIDHAIFSYGKNKNDLTGLNIKGLEYLCNNYSDILVQDELFAGIVNGDGVKVKQGIFDIPSGNVFTDSTGGILDYNLNGTQVSPLEYFYFDNSSGDLENPDIITTATVTKINTQFNNDCPSRFDIVVPRHGPILTSASTSALLISNYEGQVGDLADALDVWEATEDSTDRVKIEEDIIGIRSEMSRISNLLIKDAVFDSTLIDSTQFVSWISTRNDALHLAQLADYYWSIGDTSNVNLLLDSIGTYATGMDRGDLRTELLDFENYKNTMKTMVGSYGSLEGLDSTSEATLRTVIATKKGLAKIQAQNILCYFLGECATAPVPPISGEKLASETTEHLDVQTMEESVELQLYPNPSSRTITIYLASEALPLTIQIFDLEGRELLFTLSNENNHTINVSNFKTGTYFVVVTDKNGTAYMKKLVKTD